LSHPLRVGLISDTHGHLRPEVFDAFAGVDRVLHAGDVGDPEILADLATIAPVTAVWGNADGMAVHAVTREQAEIEVGGVRMAVIHGHQVHPHYSSLVERFPGARVIVHGHTHVPRSVEVGGAIVVNPGAAGMALKGHPPAVCILEIQDGAIRLCRVDLSIDDGSEA
jgi:putative phosphoesterase